ncbi:MAG: PDZ domain-containing protein [Planctomycetota bacterium]|nr:MAG: PDZ domain-containing protein [Planctomycetota bacterium]
MLSQRNRSAAVAAAMALALGALAFARPATAEQPVSDDPSVLEALETAYAAAARQVAPSVVGVEVDLGKKARAERARQRRAHLPAFLQRPDTPASGVRIAPELVLTALHVVKGAEAVRIVLPEGGRLPATVLATDEPLEIALLRVEDAPDDVAIVPLSGRPLPQPGAWAILVGYGPGGKSTINTGIISATGRFGGRLLQTDASINHANVGGAAVDIDGQLIGIVVAPSLRAGINSGVGFIAPARGIAEHLATLRAGTSIPEPPRGFLGIRLGEEQLDPPGVAIAETLEGHAAAKAGLQPGDVIVRIGDRTITDARSLSRAIRSHRPGEKVTVVVQRGEKTIERVVELGERPSEEN